MLRDDVSCAFEGCQGNREWPWCDVRCELLWERPRLPGHVHSTRAEAGKPEYCVLDHSLS